MSAFVMVLAAGMALSNGPEGVSAAIESPLDLRGEWYGQFPVPPCGKPLAVTVTRETVLFHPTGDTVSWQVLDEGGGRCRIQSSGKMYLGIYRRTGDHLLLCFRLASLPRPAAFGMADDQIFLRLDRTKPGK
jgi:hypothetical protein